MSSVRQGSLEGDHTMGVVAVLTFLTMHFGIAGSSRMWQWHQRIGMHIGDSVLKPSGRRIGDLNEA
jgi:hypothetical protein